VVHLTENLKNRIIDKAIELFNENGYEIVTIRHIAGALNISPGNLTYHFKKKVDILDAVIDTMLEDHRRRNYSSDISVQGLNILLTESIAHQKKYSFYFNNIVELAKRYPKIADMQTKTKIYFYNLLREILENFIKNEWIKKEPKSGLYDDLAFALFSIISFWPQQNTLIDDELSHSKSLISIVWSVLTPNLTEKGLRELNKINIE
jgi:AcrR family transcriptional regulator